MRFLYEIHLSSSDSNAETQAAIRNRSTLHQSEARRLVTCMYIWNQSLSKADNPSVGCSFPDAGLKYLSAREGVGSCSLVSESSQPC